MRAENRIGIVSEELFTAVTQLYCPNETAARRFECSFQENVCNCEGAETSVNCDCIDPLDAFEFIKTNILPQKYQGMWLEPGTPVQARAQLNTMDLTVAVHDLETKAAFDAAHCDLILSGATGCYSCSQGAVTFAQCSTDFGQAIAHVHCSNGLRFSLNCEKEAVNQSLGFLVDAPFTMVECEVLCPASRTTVHMKGNLYPPKSFNFEIWERGNSSNTLGVMGDDNPDTLIQTLTNMVSGAWGMVAYAIQHYKSLAVALCALPIIILAAYCSWVFFLIPRLTRLLLRKMWR
jgi:hypothetical protein